MKLSVVIPAYNEEKDIEYAVRDVFRVFPHCELIVVDDASTDMTFPILSSLTFGFENLKVLHNQSNRGHGYSVIKGLGEASGDYVLYIDADRQIDLSDNLPAGDVISGWRTNRQDKLFRKVISFCLKTTILLRFGYYIKDANCPYKLYKRESLLPLLDQLPRSYVVPVACLEVLARKNKLQTFTIETPHKAYEGQRVGFLQLPNKQFFQFVWQAFNEVIRL